VEEKDIYDLHLRYILSNIIEMIKDIKDILKNVVQEQNSVEDKLSEIERLLNKVSDRLEEMQDYRDLETRYRELMEKSYDQLQQRSDTNQKMFVRLLLTGFIVGLVLALFPFIALAIVDPNVLVELIKLVISTP